MSGQSAITTITSWGGANPYYRTSAFNSGNAVWPAAATAIYIPFTSPTDFTAKRMFWRNGTVTTPPTVDVGIYDAAGTRLVSMGPTAQSGANAYQFVDIADTALTKNTTYYMAMCASTGATDTFTRFVNSAGTTGASGLWGLAGMLLEASLASSTLANPATMAVWANAYDYMPLLGITNSTTIPPA